MRLEEIFDCEAFDSEIVKLIRGAKTEEEAVEIHRKALTVRLQIAAAIVRDTSLVGVEGTLILIRRKIESLVRKIGLNEEVMEKVLPPSHIFPSAQHITVH